MEIAICLSLTGTQKDKLVAGTGDWPVTFVGEDSPCRSPVVFGNPKPAIVAANRSLRWLQLESVGFGEYAALDWMRPDGPAQVTNLAGFFTDPVAESALAGILALSRGINRVTELRARGEWVGDPVRNGLRLLTDANVVLFGRGAINRRLADLLAPFRCTIIAFGTDWCQDEFYAALGKADIVVATVPDTPLTRGLFDAERLSRMKPGAVFCNFGRGSLVDEEALALALHSGRLSGAVIDVTHTEPLPAGHAFWTTPNTILTQHSGGGTTNETERKIDLFLANLNRFRTGIPLVGPVDFFKGY